MVQLAIRCHPRVPVPTEELEGWLEGAVDRLREEISLGTVRLSTLRQQLPSTDIEVGWLVELEVPEEEPLLSDGGLAPIFGDMRLLGLQPTLLVHRPGNGGQPPSTPAGGPAIIDA